MKPQKYHVYQKGLLIGTLSLLPSHVKRLEKQGFYLKKAEVVAKNAPRKRRRDTQRIDTYKTRTKIQRANPKGLVLIYEKITRIEGTKGKSSLYPGQRFFHNFKRPYPKMYGTPDRKVLVIK